MTLMLAGCGGGVGDMATTAGSEEDATTSTSAAVVEDTTATVKQNTTTTAAGTTTTAATEEGAEDVGIEDIPVELDLTEEEGAALFLEVAEGRHPEPLVISRPSWR
jgi:dihydrodipicolinate reductase